MIALYVVSPEEAAGKTAVGAGLGQYLQGQGRKVGFLKPLAAGKGPDGDVAFMKQVLGLTEDVESLGPPADDTSKIKEAADRVAAGKDVVIVEGTAGQNGVGIARDLGAKVIVVEAYAGAGGPGDSYKEFGEGLLGIVINKVPASQLKRVRGEASRRGAAILGVLPENRALLAITVGELAEGLHGRILNNADRSAELVENYMLGALVVDSGLDYFGRKDNKAAVVRSDRPDMQLAALETPTKCLVLSGSKEPPIYSVLEKAENRGIPIIATEGATADTVASIEEALSRSRFNQAKKLPRLAEILPQNLNLKAVL